MTHVPVGTLQSLVDEEERRLIRWKVDPFLRPTLGKYLFSEEFRFGSCTFYITIDNSTDIFSDTTDVAEVSLRIANYYNSHSRYSWKLSVEGSDGRLLRSVEGVEKTLQSFTLALGSPSNIKRVLMHPDGSFVLRCEIRHDSVGTADAPSAPLQHSGADALARDFEKLLSSKEATDAIVRVQGQREFHVHRAILVARTPVFASMFRHRMSETESGVVNIDDCDPDIFQLFLHFVYTGSLVNLGPEEATELYCVADKYQVEELVSLCVRCMTGVLSIESFCPTISLALQHGEKELIKKATEFFADNVDEIVLTAQWQEFLCKNPIQANELFVKALSKKRSMIEQTPKSKNSSSSNRTTTCRAFSEETDARPTVGRPHHKTTETRDMYAAEQRAKIMREMLKPCGKKF